MRRANFKTNGCFASQYNLIFLLSFVCNVTWYRHVSPNVSEETYCK